MSTGTRFLGAIFTTLLSSTLAVFGMMAFCAACGGSGTPEAPPGVPMNPPQEDTALAEMMAAVPTSAPSTTATAAAAPSTSASAAAPTASASASAGAKQPKPKQPAPAPAPAPKK